MVNEKIKNVCKECNSVVNVKLKEVDLKRIEPLLENKYKLINQIRIMKELANEEYKKITTPFVGNTYIMLFNRSKNMVELLESVLMGIEEELRYTHYYKCPVCGLHNFIEVSD